MNSLKQYIEERIETIRKEQERFSQISNSYIIKENRIIELQAVLSKIEELEEEERIQNIGEARAEDKW